MSNLSIGQLEWIRVVFTLLLVGGGAAVWTGVYWERENFPKHMRQRSWRVLLAGLASGTLAVLFLLQVDTILLRRQDADMQRLRDAAIDATRAAGIANHAAVSLRDALRIAQTTQKSFMTAAQEQQNALDAAGAEIVSLHAHRTGIERQQSQRHLTRSQKQTLVSALAPFAGQNVTIASLWGDADAGIFGQDFVSVLKMAQWNFDAKTDVHQSVITPAPTGVQVTMSQSDAEAGHPLKSVLAFVTALHKLGITSDDTVFVNAGVPSGAVVLIIGARPNP